jgi:hypothetical protein
VTDQQSELDRQIPPEKQSVKKARKGSRQTGASTEAVALGLDYLFSIRKQGYWSLCSPDKESAAWVTGYTLARLGEIPSQHITFSLRRKIDESLDWLLESRTVDGGWGFEGGSSADDTDSTAWAVIALRQHGRPVPPESIHALQRCHRSDGGFSFYHDAVNHGDIGSLSSPDATAIAVRALASIDAASSEFLAQHLRTDMQDKPSRLTSLFFVSSTLLDWEPGMAPWFVVNAVRELTSKHTGESAWEKALLLRCMMRLRMQRAWGLAASLRRVQQANGAWPGSAQLTRFALLSGAQPPPLFDEQGILATVTAVSALAMSDLQPGLYFGSDLPFRRL